MPKLDQYHMQKSDTFIIIYDNTSWTSINTYEFGRVNNNQSIFATNQEVFIMKAVIFVAFIVATVVAAVQNVSCS